MKYEPDYPGTAALMRSAEIRRLVHDVAEDAVPFAQSISPDAPELHEGYISSFRVETGEEIVSGDRLAAAYLINDAPHASFVEAAHHVLSRTADHIEGGS